MIQVTLNQAFTLAEQNIRSLISIENMEKWEVVEICRCTSKNLKSIILCIEPIWNNHKTLLEKKNAELLSKTDEYILASEDIRKSNKTLGELQATLAGLNENKIVLQADLTRLENELPGLQEDLRKKRQEKDIALGVGITGTVLTLGFGAFFTGGAIAGVVVAVTELEKDIEAKIERVNSKRTEINKLNIEAAKVLHLLENEERNKNNIVDSISRLERSRVSLDQEILLLGRKVTEIKNVQLILNLTVSKYEFLKENVEEIPDIFEIINENDVKSLLDVLIENRSQLSNMIEF